ncbi:MAG: LysE family translocator [Woeseia sp.]|jgi:threonine/homoserine/homoserine lactone efflux protein|nr:LysE family translocator [Woeseia sp.]MBT6208735.1 LysE family translocator [Woeseia sp.]
MSEYLSFIGVVAALSVGTVSPGPSFVLVARTAVAKSRAHGMGVGGVLFAGAALLGLQGLLLAVPSFYVAFKVLGGLYLCYLGLRIFRAANNPLETTTPDTISSQNSGRSFLIGLGTQVSNPKTAIVYASVFSAFLPTSFPPLLGLAVVCAVFAIETGWYSIVAIALAAASPGKAYLSYKVWVDRFAGVLIGALGAKLVSSVYSE